MKFPIDKVAEIIAKREHEGQTRWNKSIPYIVHPERIAKTQIGEDLKAAAWLHDVVEDTDVTLDKLRAEIEQFSGAGDSLDLVIGLVDALTRRKKQGETYFEFLMRIREHGDDAIDLKIADIKDNLHDLEKGNLRDKYELALFVLSI